MHLSHRFVFYWNTLLSICDTLFFCFIFQIEGSGYSSAVINVVIWALSRGGYCIITPLRN